VWTSKRLVNIDTFVVKLSNPLDSTDDKAEEDHLLHDSNIEVCDNMRIKFNLYRRLIVYSVQGFSMLVNQLRSCGTSSL